MFVGGCTTKEIRPLHEGTDLHHMARSSEARGDLWNIKWQKRPDLDPSIVPTPHFHLEWRDRSKVVVAGKILLCFGTDYSSS